MKSQECTQVECIAGRNDAPQFHSLAGNHVAGVATAHSGAAQIEMWVGRMDAGASTPPHSHDTEEVVHFLKGSGWATLGDREIGYRAGVTLILPAGAVHQIVAESETEFVAAMPTRGTIRLPYGEVLDLPWRQ